MGTIVMYTDFVLKYKRSFVEQVHRENDPIVRVRPLLRPDLCCLGAAYALGNPGNLEFGTNIHADGQNNHRPGPHRSRTSESTPAHAQGCKSVRYMYSSASDTTLFSWKS
jgi:hypothetical protein